MKNTITHNFIWIVITFATIAFLEPKLFMWIKSYIPLLLGFIMFGIGYTFDIQNIKKTLQLKRLTGIAVLARYLLLPLIGFLIGIIINLPVHYLIGLVLVASCPGGTAAGLMSLFSKANVPFTVFLTLLTTLLAPIAMPLLIYLFLHQYISISFLDIFKNISCIVLIPIIIGFFLKNIIKENTLLPNMLTTVSAFTIAIVIACIISMTKDNLSTSTNLIIPVLLLNIFGYLTGMTIAILAKCQTPEKKSLTFEYGMFDTALGVMIAVNFFNPLTALPCVLLSVIQNLTASLLVKVKWKN